MTLDGEPLSASPFPKGAPLALLRLSAGETRARSVPLERVQLTVWPEMEERWCPLVLALCGEV